MELLLFTALGFVVGLILRAGREEEARQEGIAIGRRQRRLDQRDGEQTHSVFEPRDTRATIERREWTPSTTQGEVK